LAGADSFTWPWSLLPWWPSTPQNGTLAFITLLRNTQVMEAPFSSIRPERNNCPIFRQMPFATKE